MSASPPLARVIAGPVAWAAHFIGIYGITAVACERATASAAGVVPVAIGVLTIVAAGVAAWAMRLPARPAGDARPLVAWLGSASAALALAAILVQATPALLVPACPA